MLRSIVFFFFFLVLVCVFQMAYKVRLPFVDVFRVRLEPSFLLIFILFSRLSILVARPIEHQHVRRRRGFLFEQNQIRQQSNKRKRTKQIDLSSLSLSIKFTWFFFDLIRSKAKGENTRSTFFFSNTNQIESICRFDYIWI